MELSWSRRLARSAHVQTGQFNRFHYGKGSPGDAPPVDQAVDGEEAPMAPAGSLARMRKQVLDRVLGGEVSVVQGCQEAGWSRSWFYELKARYLTYGEAGLLPKPRPQARPDRRLCAPLVDQIVAYAVNHPTEGPRS